jgi:ArsR family transcriptional regulator, arsenate/arsenite/antimonite-responsive transcriptional repressor
MIELMNNIPAEQSQTSLATEAATVKALLALAQAHRLRVFRALVMAGSSGLTPGVLSTSLGIAPTSLSFHLKELVNASLASREAQGRNLIYRAEYAQMTALLGYLTEHCCMGAPCAASDSPAAGCC